MTVLFISLSGCGFNWFGSSSENNISLEIDPINTAIAAGFSLNYRATAVFGDTTRKDITEDTQWESADPAVAQIIGNGIVKGINPGATVIKANYNGSVKSIILTITDAELTSIQIAPVHPMLAPGVQQQFTAVGIFSDGTMLNLTNQAHWNSSDTYTATVRNGDVSGGLIDIARPGITRISASMAGITGTTIVNSISTGLVSIQVTPINPSSIRGCTLRFTATGIYDNKTTINLTRQVAWSSSDTSVVKVSNDLESKGYAVVIGSGETAISASFADIMGQTMVKATSADLVSIQVTPANSRKPVGLWEQFVATGIYSDGSHHNITPDVKWSVENTDSPSPVAAISNRNGHEGKATALRPGTTTVKAARIRDGFIFNSTIEGSARYTVK